MSELTFAIDGDALLWTGDGEYLRIEPWGKNSVRVRASKMHEIQEQDGALLPQNNQASDSHDYGITIDKPSRTAELRNGDIVVQAKASCGLYSGSGYEEPRCLLSFYKGRRHTAHSGNTIWRITKSSSAMVQTDHRRRLFHRCFLYHTGK